MATGLGWSVPAVAAAAAAPTFAASPFESDCGLRLVKTDGLTDPETFSTISAGSISGGLTQEGSMGTIWIPSARCGCDVKDLALHYSVPCPDSTDGSVTLTARTSLNESDGQNCVGENLQFEVQLRIVVGGTQPAGSVRMDTECSCV